MKRKSFRPQGYKTRKKVYARSLRRSFHTLTTSLTSFAMSIEDKRSFAESARGYGTAHAEIPQSRKTERWSDADEAVLLCLADMKVDWSNIAKKLNRTELACKSKLATMKKKSIPTPKEAPKEASKDKPVEPERRVAIKVDREVDSPPAYADAVSDVSSAVYTLSVPLPPRRSGKGCRIMDVFHYTPTSSTGECHNAPPPGTHFCESCTKMIKQILETRMYPGVQGMMFLCPQTTEDIFGRRAECGEHLEVGSLRCAQHSHYNILFPCPTCGAETNGIGCKHC
jgi:hypothetical protein